MFEFLKPKKLIKINEIDDVYLERADGHFSCVPCIYFTDARCTIHDQTGQWCNIQSNYKTKNYKYNFVKK